MAFCGVINGMKPQSLPILTNVSIIAVFKSMYAYLYAQYHPIIWVMVELNKLHEWGDLTERPYPTEQRGKGGGIVGLHTMYSTHLQILNIVGAH